jgi:hypothetical protein
MKNLGIALALAGALLVTSGNTLKAAEPASVAGAWIVQVTLRDCTTNAPLGPPFNSLVTFHNGGTISESAGSLAFAPGQRTAGHGSWADLGSQYFSQRMVAQIVFDTPPNLPGTPGYDPSLPVTPGFFAGWSVVTHVGNLTDPNHLSSYGINQFYKTDGTAYRSGCSSATAVRFE